MSDHDHRTRVGARARDTDANSMCGGGPGKRALTAGLRASAARSEPPPDERAHADEDRARKDLARIEAVLQHVATAASNLDRAIECVDYDLASLQRGFLADWRKGLASNMAEAQSIAASHPEHVKVVQQYSAKAAALLQHCDLLIERAPEGGGVSLGLGMPGPAEAASRAAWMSGRETSLVPQDPDLQATPRSLADATTIPAGGEAPAAPAPDLVGAEVPHRAQMERVFGQDFGSVTAHLGKSGELAPIGAQAAARGEDVAFATNTPSPGLVAHELTHVVQQRQAGASALAAKKGVSNEGDAAEIEADKIAAEVEDGEDGADGPILVEEEPSADVSLDRGDGEAKSGKKVGGEKAVKDEDVRDDDGAASSSHTDGRPAILDWAGNAPLRSVTTSSDAETYDDRGDIFAMQEQYGFALQGDREVGSTGIFACTRKMQFDLEKGGVAAEVTVKTRAHIKADRAPNDIRQLVHTSAVWVSHDAVTTILRPEQSAKVDTAGSKQGSGQSPSELLADERLYAFETKPKERITELLRKYFDIKHRDSDDRWLSAISEKTHDTAGRLQAHEKAKKDYEDGDPMSLIDAEELLADLIRKHDGLKGDYERGGSKNKDEKRQIDRLEKLYRMLYDRYLEAFNARPWEKDGIDHGMDLLKGGASAVKNTGEGIVELGAMGADAIRHGVHEAAAAVGIDMGGWEAWSEAGKAYQEGKSTEEILEGMWDGFFDRLDKAFEHGRNGDFSQLFEITAETGLDAGLGLATAGTGTAASWSARAGKAAKKTADLRRDMAQVAKRLVKRAKDALKDLKKTLKAGGLPKWGKDAVKAMGTFVENVGERFALAGADGSGFAKHVPDSTEARAMMREAGIDRATDKALATLKKRRPNGMKAAEQRHFVMRLQAIAAKVGDSEISRVLAKLGTVEKLGPYVAKIEELLDMTTELAVDDLVACLKRSTQVRDGAAFLDDVAAFAKRDLSGVAKSTILQKAAVGTPPDLDWLRKLNITDERLEYLASNPATNWRTFMKVSEGTSDAFPAALDERFSTTKDKNAAYGDAGVKLRGVAGELAVKEMDLDPLKITREQVDVRDHGVDSDKKIDFGVSGPKGPGLLEVKGWSVRTWKKQLKAAAAGNGGDAALQHLVVQLDAAAKTGKPVYLAVTNALDAATRKHLMKFLESKGHDAVELVYFSEDKLKGIAKELRNAMMLGAGVALAIDDETEASNDEED